MTRQPTPGVYENYREPGEFGEGATVRQTPPPVQQVEPFAWYWFDEHGCLYITGDDRKPDVPADAKPLYEHPAHAPVSREDVPDA